MNGIPKDKGKISISGGDMRLIEVAKNLKGFDIEFLTSENGRTVLNEFGLKKYKKHLIKYNNSSEIIDNIRIALVSFLMLPRALKNYHGIVYSSCEHIYDILPALRLKLLNKCEWIAVYHWVENYPWNDKRGGTPVLKRYLYWLNRYIAGLLIKYFSNKILAVSKITETKLIKIKKVNPKKIKAVSCGVNFNRIIKVSSKYNADKEKKYDAIYIKRLNYGKGIMDLLQIWKVVSQKNKNVKLAIIGEGTREVKEKINMFINENKLNDNIELLGVIYDFNKKIKTLSSSKLFILPSYEENWAIVIGEALACGIPVIAYNLREIKPIWRENVEWVRLGNINDFSKKILNALDKKQHEDHLTSKRIAFMKQYDWKKIARNELL
jgi:glycosyltransferase involved in cell wall biosynthesis